MPRGRLNHYAGRGCGIRSHERTPKLRALTVSTQHSLIATLFGAVILWGAATHALSQQFNIDPLSLTEYTGDTGFDGYIAEARDQYNIYVFGDTLADGVGAGFSRLLAGDPKTKVHQRSRAGTGLGRPDRYDWNRAVAKLIEGKRVDVAVVFIGANDTHSATTTQGRFAIGTDQWRAAYTAYVNEFLAQFKAHGTAVYWISLPAMWRPSYDQAIKQVSEVQRQSVLAAGMKFFNMRNLFADEQGNFVRGGFDLQGQFRNLRSRDGVHFLRHGNDKLAALLYQVIEKDIQVAERGGVSDFDSGTDGTTTRVTSLNLPIFAQESETGAAIPVDLGTKIAPVGTLTADDDDPANRNRSSLIISGSAHNVTFSPEVTPGSAAAKVLLEGESVEPKAGRADDFSWSGE